jgi:hypothetical protein
MPTGSNKPTTTINQQNNDPWGPSQQYLTGTMAAAGKLRSKDIGYKPYPNSTVAPLTSEYKTGMNAATAAANMPVANLTEGNAAIGGLLNSDGWTPDLRQAQGYLDPFARGDYTEDPRLTARLQQQTDDSMNASATRFGGGRYGSAGIGRGVGEALSNATNDTILQANEAARGRQLQASGMLGQLSEGVAGRAQQGRLGALSMIPGMDALKYQGSDRLMELGNTAQDRAQGILADKVNRYNAAQARPWEQLGRANAIYTGIGQMGGTQAGSSMQSGKKTPWYQQAAGVAGLLGAFL